MKSMIIGREREVELLRNCCKSDKSEFVVIYGRRRVGKTFLVNETLSKYFVFQATGIYDQPKSVQLKNFYMSMQKWFPSEHLKLCKATKCPGTWLDMFAMLEQLLRITQRPRGGRKVIFLDELPWMDTQKSGFLPAFEHFWNDYAAWTHDIVLVVCGSAATWIVKKVLNSRGGLHNRQTKEIRLMPFNLAETEKFLRKKGIRWNRYDIAQCYMTIGGIPYYLDNLPTGMNGFPSAIDEIFFREGAILRDEYLNLYRSLFKNSILYRKIVEALAKKRSGMTQSEIIKETKLSDGGMLSESLESLELCGFIRRFNAYGKKSRDSMYQLVDFYTLFYLQFIGNDVTAGGPHWQTMIDSPSRRAWSGYAFEQLCLAHIEQMRAALGFNAVNCSVSAWRTNATEEYDGAQIDLVIERRDQIIHLCEMKFSNTKYVIDKDYDEVLRNKLDAFKMDTGTNYALYLTMITNYGIKPNAYSGIVAAQVKLDDLFKDRALPRL